MPSYRNSGATHDSVRGQSRRHSGFPRQRRALPQSGCIFPDVEFCRKDTEGHSLCGFSRTLKRRVESKVIGDISPFPNITTIQGTPVANGHCTFRKQYYLTTLDLNCGLREPLHRVHGALVSGPAGKSLDTAVYRRNQGSAQGGRSSLVTAQVRSRCSQLALAGEGGPGGTPAVGLSRGLPGSGSWLHPSFLQLRLMEPM